MSNDIRSGLSGVSAVNLSRGSVSGNRAGAALSSLANQIAGHIADTLDLASDSDQDRGGNNFITANDLYEIETLSRQLSNDISADGSEAARLTAALHQFAEQSAALIGARPAAYSVEHLADAIEGAVANTNGPENFSNAMAIIESASSAVAQAK